MLEKLLVAWSWTSHKEHGGVGLGALDGVVSTSVSLSLPPFFQDLVPSLGVFTIGVALCWGCRGIEVEEGLVGTSCTKFKAK